MEGIQEDAMYVWNYTKTSSVPCKTGFIWVSTMFSGQLMSLIL